MLNTKKEELQRQIRRQMVVVRSPLAPPIHPITMAGIDDLLKKATSEELEKLKKPNIIGVK